MGTDKALISLFPGGPPLLKLVIDRVYGLSADIFIVSPPRSAYSEFGIPVVPDRFDDAGPLGAIATALQAAVADVCLVVSCDMPLLNRTLLSWMMEQPRDYDVLIPQLPGTSRQDDAHVFQTMHAMYAKRCLPAIDQALANDQRRVASFLEQVKCSILSECAIRQFDPECRSFLSVNSPDELATARGILLQSMNVTNGQRSPANEM